MGEKVYAAKARGRSFPPFSILLVSRPSLKSIVVFSYPENILPTRFPAVQPHEGRKEEEVETHQHFP